MLELVSRRSSRLRYNDLFVFGLLSISAVPLALSAVNFEITNSTVYAITATWSLLLVLIGAHVWITPVYYFNRRWRTQFRKRPVVYFIAPAAMLFGCTAIMLWHNVLVGLTVVYASIAINVWHHAKQNWGVLALIAKSRNTDVSFMRGPVVYAWPFFVTSIALYMPEVANLAGANLLRSVAYLLAAAYTAWCIVVLWNNRKHAQRDPVIFAYCAALMLYFIPLVAMFGKPYALVVTFGAHALQYYFLTVVSLSLRERRSIPVKDMLLPFSLALIAITVATLAACAALSGYGPPALWDSLWVRLVVGFVTGVNLVHFWVDAFIWRFSDKETRALHGEAFVF